MSAAARAAEFGARVAVIEKGLDDDYPCNTRVSGGVIHVAQHDVKLPEAELRAITEAETAGFSEAELLDVLIKDTRRAIDFLRSRGANFVRGYNHNWVFAPPRPSVNNLVWKGLGNDRTLKLLAHAVREGGGEMLFGHKAEDLMMSEGTCRGVVVTVDGSRRKIDAKAVVIADGGFHANPDLLRKYVGPKPEHIFPRNAGQSMGDGLKMAVVAGAETTPLNRFYGHLLSLDAFRNPELWPYPQLDLVALAGIIVDKTGRRLFDEGLGGIHAANSLAASDDPAGGIIVCDADQWESSGTEALIPPNPRLERAGGTVFKADGLAALASAAGIEADALSETVRGYNEALATDRLSSMHPPRSSHKKRPMPIVKAPFRAIPICAGITNTMGGLRIDIHGRVRKAGGGTIPGLYAAGAATGGLEGGPKLVYVGGLCRAVVFGMRAAEHVMRAA
jgi:fumarate reductase flavoprotein subunit